MAVFCGCCDTELNDDVSDCCGDDVTFTTDGLGNEYRHCAACDEECDAIDIDEYNGKLVSDCCGADIVTRGPTTTCEECDEDCKAIMRSEIKK